jgi:hypothetical protein
MYETDSDASQTRVHCYISTTRSFIYSLSDRIEWLIQKEKQFSVDIKSKSILIKFDNDDDQLSEVQTSYKRVKLTHHQDTS